MSALSKEDRVLVVVAVLMLLAALVGWVVKSHFESASYNRITGAHTTTWDAMWVELRVQDRPK